MALADSLTDCLSGMFMPAMPAPAAYASATMLSGLRRANGLQKRAKVHPEPEPEPQEAARTALATVVPMETEEGSSGAAPGSPVFGRVAPPSASSGTDSINTAAAALSERAAHERRARQRVAFGTTNCVRTIGAPAAADSECWLKEHDGPNRPSIMMDSLLHAFFEKGGNKSLEALQFALGADLCRDIGASAAELSGRCWQLAAQLEAAEAGAGIGVLPSCSHVCGRHAPGVKVLAQWLWTSELEVEDTPVD